MRNLFWTCTLTFFFFAVVSAQDFHRLKETIETNVPTIAALESLNNFGRIPPSPELVGASKAIAGAAAQIYTLPDLTEENRRWTLRHEAVALVILAYAEPATYYSRLTRISDELETRGLQRLAQETEKHVLEIGSDLATRSGNNAVNINVEPLAERMVMYAERYPATESRLIIENFLQRIRRMSAIPRDRRLAVVAPIFQKYYQDINHEDRARALDSDIFRSTLQGQNIILMGVDIDGKDFELSSVRDKVVLLHFWGTWCSNCKEQMPELIALHEKYHKDGLVIIGVNTGTGGDDERKVKQWLEATTFGGKKIPWLTLHEGLGERKNRNSITKFYGINELPVLILIGRDGKVRHLHPLLATLDDRIAEATSIFADVLTEEEKKQRDELIKKQQEEIDRQIRTLLPEPEEVTP